MVAIGKEVCMGRGEGGREGRRWWGGEKVVGRGEGGGEGRRW